MIGAFLRHGSNIWLALLLAALALRVAGTWGGVPAAVLAGAVLQALAFLVFAAWVWRASGFLMACASSRMTRSH